MVAVISSAPEEMMFRLLAASSMIPAAVEIVVLICSLAADTVIAFPEV